MRPAGAVEGDLPRGDERPCEPERPCGPEEVRDGERLLAIRIPAGYAPPSSGFVTADEHPLQVGFIVYPSGGEVAPHAHLPVERELRGTSEALLVRSGRCLVDLYRDDRTLCRSLELSTGDVIVLVSGGHGFRMLEDTTFLEVKQGPYAGPGEKLRFTPVEDGEDAR